MSVVAAKPKRLFDDASEDSHFTSSVKRARFLHNSPSGRCVHHHSDPSYALSSSQALAALAALFPEMDDKAIG